MNIFTKFLPGAVLLSLFLFIPAFTDAQKKQDTISFIHITDIHFCNLTGYHPEIAKRRQHYGEGVEPFLTFFNSIPGKLKSDFVVITGDMIDFYEGKTARGNMMDTQVEQFATLLGKAQVPVYLTLGNHDIASYTVDDGSISYSSQYNSGRARAAWIRNAPSFRDGTYYSRVMQVGTTTYRLIFLDNAYYTPDGPAERPFTIDPYQLHWLDNELKKSDTDVEIIFMHMPLINPNRDDLEPTLNKYFLNLKDTIAIHHDLKMTDDNSLDIYNVLQQNASARLVFTGHRHSSVAHNVRFPNDYSLTQVMTGSFARDPRNWRLIQLTSENIIISYPGDVRRQYTIPLK
jgi:3',5'-cyclic AMP phosphodiesterase CpdA